MQSGMSYTLQKTWLHARRFVVINKRPGCGMLEQHDALTLIFLLVRIAFSSDSMPCSSFLSPTSNKLPASPCPWSHVTLLGVGTTYRRRTPSQCKGIGMRRCIQISQQIQNHAPGYHAKTHLHCGLCSQGLAFHALQLHHRHQQPESVQDSALLVWHAEAHADPGYYLRQPACIDHDHKQLCFYDQLDHYH